MSGNATVCLSFDGSCTALGCMPDMGARRRMLQAARNPDDIRWLPGAHMNIADSALSMRDPDAPALIWAAEEAPGALHTLSLGELRTEALRFAAALKRAGFSAGEAIRPQLRRPV